MFAQLQAVRASPAHQPPDLASSDSSDSANSGSGAASDREGEGPGGRSAGWLFGWGGGSEEVDAGVSSLDRCVRDPEGARELGWAGGWDSDAGAES